MQSLGILEVKGLAMGIAACDAMVKSANVKLIGHEYTKGGGWCTIKVEGDVASVKAALDAGEAVAACHKALVSQTVLARPSKDAEKMVVHAHKKMPKVKDIVPEQSQQEA